jgi:hypothetical protein
MTTIPVMTTVEPASDKSSYQIKSDSGQNFINISVNIFIDA